MYYSAMTPNVYPPHSLPPPYHPLSPPDKMRLFSAESGIIFGRTISGRVGLRFNSEGNVLLIGGPGSGKSSCIIMPTLSAWDGPFVAVDIKGDLEAHYIRAGEAIQKMLIALPRFKPFDCMNLAAEQERIFQLFLGENGDRIEDTYQYRSKVATLDFASKYYQHLPASDFNHPELVQEVEKTLQFYSRLSDELTEAHKKLEAFVPKAETAERFDEAHLLPIAMEVFGEMSFPMKTEYIAIAKTRGSITRVTARRLTFDSYLSFILTDFFEGLHYGHYPRRCPICGRYFLMQSARRQQYCNGIAPEKYKGKSISCRKYAILLGRRERAANDPVKAAYAKRCAAIRAEKSKGVITAEYAAGLLALAKRRLQQAMEDDAYAKKQYLTDMKREKLYWDYDQSIQ